MIEIILSFSPFLIMRMRMCLIGF